MDQYQELFKIIETMIDENKRLKKENKRLKKFYDEITFSYGQGYEVANFHLNGELEAFDNFIKSAQEEMEK